ncbi:MAG: endolytic transglycosylase MltG [Proteobacteria bacterium]|nr:endolytic transglycosylase MltG [Pseudomonadota bacterium]
MNCKIREFISNKYFLYSLISIFILLTFFFISIAYWFQHPQKNNSTIILIQKGASLSQITKILTQQHLLNFPIYFKGILYGTGGWRQLKAGEYVIPPAVTPAQLIHILKSGNVILHPISLIEGETSYHLTQRLGQDSRFDGICEVSAEGSLLPETYHFPRGTARQKIVERMQASMQSLLTNVWAQRSSDHPLKTPQELVILASIIEKETSLSKERPIVAAVFLNRLKQGMPLQADPTIIYALTKGERDLMRDLTREDLVFESPYNTYLNLGLPPSPIANPGCDSLKAAANPANVSYLYFVADGTGGHIFATSLEEHQKNHAHWRKVRDKR